MADSPFLTALAMAIDKQLIELVVSAAATERLSARQCDALALATAGLVAGRLEASLDLDDAKAVELVDSFKRIGAQMVAMAEQQRAAGEGRPN